jgi:hypothetical protein
MQGMRADRSMKPRQRIAGHADSRFWPFPDMPTDLSNVWVRVRAENICSVRVFRVLTHRRHGATIQSGAYKEMSKFVLTFVHGTWGRGMIWPSGDAVWTTDASTICKSLRDRLGPDAVFRRFPWSGRNSHTARLNASKRLRDFLQEGLAASPDATHIVIAHSHGGNIALMALGDSNLRERIAGVACLATPFIVAWDRNIGLGTWVVVGVSGTGLVFLLIKLLYRLNAIEEWIPRIEGWNNPFVAGAALGIASLLFVVFFLLVRRMKEHASKLRRELTPRPLDKHQLLLLRSPGDEASASLAVFQFLSQLTVRLFHFGESLHLKVEDLGKPPRKLLWIGASAGAVAFGIFPFLYFVSKVVFGVDLKDLVKTAVDLKDVVKPAPWVLIPTFVVFAISFVIFISALKALIPAVPGMIFPRIFRPSSSTFAPLTGELLAVLMWLAIPLLSILMLPFGWQAAVANIFLNVTAETTPPGSWEIHLIEPPTSEEIGAPVPPLMHKVYENPRVQIRLGEWIETLGWRGPWARERRK